MTILEAIQEVDALKPNTYTQSMKIKWLSTLDGMIKNQVIDTHEGFEGVTFSPYDDETPLNTELLVKNPYDSMYIAWLESKIDYVNGEYTKYNNSITRYNDIYSAFNNEYNRNHTPLTSSIRYW